MKAVYLRILEKCDTSSIHSVTSFLIYSLNLFFIFPLSADSGLNLIGSVGTGEMFSRELEEFRDKDGLF